MSSDTHILINALSMGSGGGFTVGREVLRHLAIVRPQWRITCAIIAGHPLHEQMKQAQLPANCALVESPPSTRNRAERLRWEKSDLARWTDQNRVAAVVQLNGMLVPTMKPPTLCHMQDPWPYRSEAWGGFRDRIVALLKRREHRYALKHARCFGWTSAYLRDLICGHHKIWPESSEVLYNGVPTNWIERSRAGLPDWFSRRNEIVTISNVNLYKRQSLVIEAMPLLIKRPGLEDLTYRIVGAADSQEFEDELKDLAKRLGVGDRVIFEGRVSDERVKEVFAGARAYVLMSVCESFGIPAIEAMSFGTPVITADCCAMPEVCGDAAELSPPDDAPALAERIAKVLLDPQRVEELRRRGVERVAKFSWTRVAEKMASLLERAALRG